MKSLVRQRLREKVICIQYKYISIMIIFAINKIVIYVINNNIRSEALTFN